MRILIYGATDMGYSVAYHLCNDHDITILDDMERLPERFGGLDISFVSGSGSDVEILEQIEAGKTDMFIACSDRDEANIVACWTIKRTGDVETVCFVRTNELHTNLERYHQKRFRTPYDVDMVIWPERLLTEEIFRIVSVPEAIDVKYFAKGRAKLFEYRIKEDSAILSKRIRDCSFPANVLIVGITRDDKLFIPDGSTIIAKDDKVVFMGSGPALDILAARFFHKRNVVKKAMVIGGGNVGFQLAAKLEQTGVQVTLIEQSQKRCMFLADNLKSTLVLNGDGTDFELLESEGVEEVDVTICTTDNDEKNLLCSLLVRQIGAARIIARVGNARTAELFDRAGIDVVVSPRGAALRELLNRVQAELDIDVLAFVEGGKGEVLRITLPDKFKETRVADLKFQAQAIIGAVQRQRQIIIPNGDTIIAGGDLLKIFTMAEDAEIIRKMFAK